MSEQKTVYEVVELWSKEDVVLAKRDVVVRKISVKFIGDRQDIYGQGKTAGGYGSTAPIEICDFTPADAWARFIAKVEGEIVDLEEQLTARRTVLADAVAKAGSEPAP